ncbi:MAG: ATP-binding protein [Prevotella sp.]|nr:ATP-binding protein [Prevotellaceae bacterium]MDY4555297.1 ATP-binding protein [Prevotella sp.]
MKENSLYDRKSLRAVLGKTADFNELAKDCVAFSNAQGGVIDIGIEDNNILPPEGQTIPEGLTTTIVNKISSLTNAVTVAADVCMADNNAEYIKLHVLRSLNAVSVTSSGKIFIRIGDKSTPVGPEDIARLAEDKGCISWEDTTTAYKYDQYGEKVNKWLWDDYTRNPSEMISELWDVVPEWKESTEISDGMFRRNVPAYPEKVIRELAANALVHRPYTIKGDVFINIHPDYIEVVNPGRLPLGVTVENILHTTKKRNEHMANLFYVLHLMEREGSGYDMMYETLLANGKSTPKVTEGDDWVKVRVERKVINQELYLKDSDALRPWLHPLIDKGLVLATEAKTKAKEYRVNTMLLKDSQYKGRTTLKRIEKYRIKELIIEDLKIYKEATKSEIQSRIGEEIPPKKIWEQINILIAEGKVKSIGQNRWRRYIIIE